MLTLFSLIMFSGVMFAQEKTAKKPTKPFYPLAVGNEWTYRVNGNNSNTFVLKVKEKTKIEKLTCYVFALKDDKELPSEYVCEKKDGLYRVKIGKDKLIKPPLLILKLPVKKKLSWKVNSEVGIDEIRGEFQATLETIDVPAGKFSCIKVKSVNLNVLGSEMKITAWYARDVGQVKQRLVISGVEVTTELTKYNLQK